MTNDEQASIARRCGRIGAAIALLFLLFSALYAQANEKDEKLKAAFVYNFSKFITWPDAAFEGGSSPLRICVVGSTDLTPLLRQGVDGKVVKGHGFEILEYADAGAGDLSRCHLLFLSESASGQASAVLAATSGSHTASVGETEGFATQGGTLNFVNRDGKLKVELNSAAGEKMGLKFDGKLMQIAILVGS